MCGRRPERDAAVHEVAQQLEESKHSLRANDHHDHVVGPTRVVVQQRERWCERVRGARCATRERVPERV